MRHAVLAAPLKLLNVALGISVVLLLAAATSAASAGFKVYVSNQNSGQIAIFDENHAYLNSISDPSASSLRGLQVAANGHIYAASNGTSMVVDFASNDAYLTSFGSVAGFHGLAVGDDNRIYCGGFDGTNNVGRIYTPDGTQVGQFSAATSALVVTSSGYLAGVDNGPSTVAVMTLDGVAVRGWDVGGKPRGIAEGPDGHLYVGRGTANDIQVYDIQGTLIRTITNPSLLGPYGLEFSPNGTLYVANFDAGNVLELNYATGAVLATISDHLSGPVDITFRVTACTDADGDGYFAEAGCGAPRDCNDTNPAIHPGATEICNGIDDNCDGQIDEGFDQDHDGFTRCGGDCNDNDAAVYPGAPQLCDGKNNNCSDPNWPIVPANEADADHDGYRICQGDCDDTHASVYPGAPEICDGLDNNCNGQVDEDASGADSDGDGIHNACDNCRFVANPTQTDSDGDHVGNACDNCINTPNPSQADADGDGRGDACDNCPNIPNGFQDDTDADRVGDACDNCPLDYNPTQSDFDHDGEGDICDLNDGLIYIYSTDSNYREWQPEAGYTAWNSYRGSLSVLRATGQFTQAPGSNPLAARACGVSDPYVFDADVLAPGDVTFNLVTGVAGGVESSLGTNSAGVPRANANPCP